MHRGGGRSRGSLQQLRLRFGHIFKAVRVLVCILVMLILVDRLVLGRGLRVCGETMYRLLLLHALVVVFGWEVWRLVQKLAIFDVFLQQRISGLDGLQAKRIEGA